MEGLRLLIVGYLFIGSNPMHISDGICRGKYMLLFTKNIKSKMAYA